MMPYPSSLYPSRRDEGVTGRRAQHLRGQTLSARAWERERFDDDGDDVGGLDDLADVDVVGRLISRSEFARK